MSGQPYDYLIVGAGFFGATFARQAADNGERCLVIDSADHIAGAAFDKEIEGIHVGMYGAHIFHTKSRQVWDYVQRFAAFNTFINKPKAIASGNAYSFPINLMTLAQVWGVTSPQEARAELAAAAIKIPNPRNAEEWLLSRMGRLLYELFFYGYTRKQWHREPSELPISIVQRVPIRLTYEENYFSTDYQGMPIGGYTNLIGQMLDDWRITVELATRYETKSYEEWCKIARRIVYCGPVDRLVSGFPDLEYNTMRFEVALHEGDQQGNAVLNWCDYSVPALRTIEHRHFYDLAHLTKHADASEKDRNISVVTSDIPALYSEHPEPYYPIRDTRNSEVYAACAKAAKLAFPRLTLGGRIGEYKYLDMDQTIASAIAKYKALNK